MIDLKKIVSIAGVTGLLLAMQVTTAYAHNGAKSEKKISGYNGWFKEFRFDKLMKNTHGQDSVDHSRCDKLINERLSDLSKASSKTKNQNQIQTAMTGLTDLKAKCAAETNRDAVKADIDAIYSQFRIYAVQLPQILFDIPVFGHLLRHLGHIKVECTAGTSAYSAALTALRQGKSVAIFIEGQLSPVQGGFHEPKTGPVRLSLETGAPIIPIGFSLDRTFLYQTHSRINQHDTDALWYFRGPYAVTFRRPVTVNGNINNWDEVRRLSVGVMGEVIDAAAESDFRLYRLKLEQMTKHLSFSHTSWLLCIMLFTFPVK